MILIIGSEGSMGMRYKAILKFLRIPFFCYDIKFHGNENFLCDFERADGIIISTPTDTHFKYISELSSYKKPILCEKPLSKDIKQLRHLKKYVKEGLNLTMMMQYKMLDDANQNGESFYDYFKSGNDGLNWDCIQIIGLARGKFYLSNQSPIWSCRLNGKDLKLSDMDFAYIEFIRNWFKKPGDDLDRIIEIHEKVLAN